MVWQHYSVFLYFPFKNKKEILLKENLFLKSLWKATSCALKSLYVLVFYVGIFLLYVNNTSMISPVF